MSKNYYIVCNKHASGFTRLFWKSDSCGYTKDLNEAGIYKGNEMKLPIISKENLNDKGKYDNFFITVEDVELLGKKMACILN